MMHRNNQNPIDLLKRANALGITANDYKQLRILLAKGYDPRVYAGLEASIAARELSKSFNTIPFETPDTMHGDIILGKNSKGLNRYDSRYAPSHLLGIGASGVGKTVFLTSLLLQYLQIARGMLVFDFIKRELRGIRRLAQNMGYEVIVCRHENLLINLLDPQGTNPKLYANICSEFLTLNLAMPPVAKHILKICITNLYERCGMMTNRQALPPILSELIQEVKAFEGNRSAKDAILLRLQALLANKSDALNIRRGINISLLENMFVIFELDGLESQYQNLLVSYLLSMLFAQRVENQSNGLIVVALDEASRLYSKKVEAANEGPSYISTMTTVGRSKEIALFVWSQSCYDLSNSIIANSGIKILCRAGTANDYDTFGRAMGMTGKETQWCKTGLDVGMQVIKLGFGWLKPFLNRSPLVTLPTDVSDTEVYQSGKTLLETIPQPSRQAILLPAKIESATTPPANKAESLSNDEKVLLEQIKSNPSIPSATTHYKNTGLSTKRGLAAKQALINRNLIKETALETGGRGRAKLFLEVIGNCGKYGNALHCYQRDIADAWYRTQDCITEFERNIQINGEQKFVDLSVTWPDSKTEAVEIETADSERAVENILKNIAAGYDVISVLTPNRKTREAIKNRFMAKSETSNKNRVRFISLKFYR